jgi:hypothetical protein
MVKFNRVAVVPAMAALALAALVSTDLSASAQTAYRPLTVGGHHEAPRGGYYVVPAAPPQYNPYAGPAALVTAPFAFVGTLVSLPFRAVNAIFPGQGNTPLTVIGAPVMLAGRVAEAPFRIAQQPFGGPGPFAY